MAERVNITTAAKLTGRAEKTIRAWLAEDPCPLSIEWGNFRGGRRLGGKGAKVEKGRTRLLDVDELRALHVARGGIDWNEQYLPVPDVRALVARVAELEAQLAILREHSPWLFSRVARSEAHQTTLDSLDVQSPYQAPRRRPSASTARQLAPGEFPVSANGRGKWVEAHGGPGRNFVREWPDVLQWRGPEDAIAAVRRHKNWHDWQPIGLEAAVAIEASNDE